MNTFDKYIQELLNTYTETPSADCWNQISDQLNTLQMSDSGANCSSSASSGGKGAHFSQFMGSITAKAVLAVVASAAIGGVIFWTTSDSPQNELQTDNEISIISEEIQNEYILVNEEDIQQEKELATLCQKNENTDLENQSLSFGGNKDTIHPEEITNVTVLTIQNAVSTPHTPTQSSKTETTSETETISKIENKVQTASKEPNKRFFANKTELVDDATEKEQPQNVIEIPKFIIPNIFSPNGDGINDYFVIEGIEQFSETYLYVSNRFSVIVYEKSNYRNNWGAENLSDGVYFYVFTFVYQGSQSMRQGSVTVKR